MQHRRMRALMALPIAGALALTACGSDSKPADTAAPATSAAPATTAPSDVTTPGTTPGTSGTTPGSEATTPGPVRNRNRPLPAPEAARRARP